MLFRSAQLDVEGFEALLQQWMAAQPGVAETVDALVCDGKTLRGLGQPQASEWTIDFSSNSIA